MEQFGFDELNDDDQLELLKYMPIKERVRFERVNKNWASLLEGLWLRQKQLWFGNEFDEYFGRRAKCHPFTVNDCYEYPKYPHRNYMPAEVIFKVISCCKNLKALKDVSHVFDCSNIATRLANILNDNCKELEHLDIMPIDRKFFELFNPSDKFNCLVHSDYRKLKVLHDKKSPPGPLPMKIIAGEGVFHQIDVNPMSWNLINELTVDHLVTPAWDVKYNELINLISLKVDRVYNNIMVTSSRLEYVSLSESHSIDLRRIFERNRKLVSLKLSSEGDQVLPTIFEFGSNLKELYLGLNNLRTIKEFKFWKDLTKLTKLRSLTICAHSKCSPVEDTKLSADGLVLVLKTCTKLKYFQYIDDTTTGGIVTEDEKEQIQRVVAEKSFRQLFVVTYGHVYDSGRHHAITVK